jgi:hypothetical protein
MIKPSTSSISSIVEGVELVEDVTRIPVSAALPVIR